MAKLMLACAAGDAVGSPVHPGRECLLLPGVRKVEGKAPLHIFRLDEAESHYGKQDR